MANPGHSQVLQLLVGDSQQLVPADFFSLKGFDVLLEAVVQALGTTQREHGSYETNMCVTFSVFPLKYGLNWAEIVLPFVFFYEGKSGRLALTYSREVSLSFNLE